MPEGKHNLHLRYADEFNKLVENFLEEWKTEAVILKKKEKKVLILLQTSLNFIVVHDPRM